MVLEVVMRRNQYDALARSGALHNILGPEVRIIIADKYPLQIGLKRRIELWVKKLPARIKACVKKSSMLKHEGLGATGAPKNRKDDFKHSRSFEL